MSSFYSSLRGDVLNYAQYPNNTNQIACRLCKQVFTTTQALIAHIESHMKNEEVAMRSIYSPNYMNSQRNLVSPFLPPTFPMTRQLQETRKFSDISNSFQASSQSAATHLLRRNSFFSGSQVGALTLNREMKLSSPSVLSGTGNNAMDIANLSILQTRKRKLADLSPVDGTREFIVQLEKPLKKIDFIDLVNIDDDNSDVKPLNLALKL
ncbi:hypothetical protein Lal_00043286 [Lupinus albus]|uniref:Putative transcription factor C2H2 family n=1 Tax=Lupinus albus TaxID=3870 RepID=A0A6A5PF06_LUPAL|nr:putative transcription factor C2H2 family [Lupinus albus]KAF1896336.1 hypothetical protein Lal_00043286 [Lupinus albus]